MRAHRLAALIILAVTQSAPAATETWNKTAAGTYSWNDAANWTPATIPNATGEVANLTNAITGDQTITLDAQITVGTLAIGNNTANGSFRFASGTGGSLSFSSGGALTVSAGDDNQFVTAEVKIVNGLTVTNSSTGVLTLGGPVTIAAGGLTVAGTGDTIITGVISGASSLTKSSTSTATLTLGTANVYIGSTTISAGTLRLGAANAVPVGTSLTLGQFATTTATLDLAGFAQTLSSVSGATVGGNISRVVDTVGGGRLVLTTGVTVNTVAFGNGAGGDGFSLVSASGTLTLLTPSAGGNTFTGGAYAVNFAKLADSPSATVKQFGTGTATAQDGGVLEFNTATTFQAVAGVVARTGGQVDLRGITGTLPAGGITLSGLRAGSGALVNSGAATTVSGGTVTLGSDAGIAGSGAITVNGQIAGGSNDLYKMGGNTLTLGGGSNTLGNVFVAGGVLAVGATDALGTSTKAAGLGTYISTFAALSAAIPGGGTVAENITLYGSTTGGALQAGATGQTFAGAITIPQSITGNVGGTTDFAVSGAITGPGSLAKDGANTVTLSGTNAYLGGTTINAGTLRLGSDAALPAGRGVIMNGTATLDLNGFSPSIGDFNSGFTSTVVVTNNGAGPATLTTTVTGSRILGHFQDGTGQLGLTKTGGGTLNMQPPAANTYTGSTTVNSGKLQVGFRVVTSSPLVTLTTNMINPASPLVLGGGTLEVTTITDFGTLPANTTVSQTFSGTTVNAGAGGVTASPPSGGMANVFLGTITRNAGGTLNFSPPSSGVINVTGGTAGAVLGGWATAGSGANWATVDGSGNVGVFSNYATSNTLPSNGAANLTSGTTSTSGSVTINSLRLAGGTANISGTDTLTITTGGVIAPPFGGTIQGGTLVPGAGGEMIFNVPFFSTVTVGTAAQPTTIGGSALTLSGAGTLDLTRSTANTFTGKVYVVNSDPSTSGTFGGTLRIGADGSLGAVPGGFVADAITLVGTSNGIGGAAGAFLQLATSFTGSINSNRGITLAGVTGGIDTNGVSTTYGGVITGPGGFVKAGNGTLTLSGTNTYAGTTTVSGGTLRLGADNVLPSTGLLFGNSSGTLDLNGHAQQLGGLASGLSSAAVFNSSGTAGMLNLNVSGVDPVTTGNYSFAGQLGTTGQANFGLTKTGPATQVLTNLGNLYAGGTVVTGGTLAVSGDGALGAPATIVLNGGALSNNQTTFTLSANRGIVLGPAGAAGAGTIDVISGTLTYNGVIADNAGGTGTLVKTGGSILVLGGTSTYTGRTEVRGGTLQLGADNALPAGTTVLLGNPFETGANGTGALDLNGHEGTVAGVGSRGLSTNNRVVNTVGTAGRLVVNIPSGTSTLDARLGRGVNDQANFALAKDGAGTLVVAAVDSNGNSQNNYTGATEVRNGTLRLGGSTGNILPTTTTVTLGNLSNSGTLDLNGQAQTVAGLTTSGAGTANRVVNANTVAPATLAVNLAGTTSFAGTLGATGQNDFALTKSGAGVLELTGTNTYAGQTTVTTGTLRVGNGGSTGTLGTGPVSLATGTTLAFNRSDAHTAANVIFGAGAVTQQAGTLTLTGTSLYTGGTTVSGGTLLANNTAGSATGTGAVTVNGGTAVLGGTGAVGGAVTVKGGGTLNPGASVGTLAVTNSVTFGSSTDNGGSGSQGVFRVEVGGTTTADRLAITGASNFVNFVTAGTSPTNTEVYVDFSPLMNTASPFVDFTTYHYTIATTANPSGVQVNGSPSGTLNQVVIDSNYAAVFPAQFASPATFSLSRSGNNLVLDFTPVPEPAATVAVLLAGLAGAGAWRRRRGVVE